MDDVDAFLTYLLLSCFYRNRLKSVKSMLFTADTTHVVFLFLVFLFHFLHTPFKSSFHPLTQRNLIVPLFILIQLL
jgi:hypothetical protein